MVLPDHATPLSLKTHVSDPVCFAIFGKDIIDRGFTKYCEKEAEKSELYFESGPSLMSYFMSG